MGDDRPNVILTPEKLTYQVADEVLGYMGQLYRNMGLYQFGGRLTRVARYEPFEENATVPIIQRERGALVLVAATPAMLVDRLTREIKFFAPVTAGKGSQKTEGLKPVDLPTKVAVAILSRVGEWPVPRLRGVVEAPVLLWDNGRILNQPGFDDATGLLLSSDERWLPIPETPTRKEVNTAVRALIGPFREFPYTDEIGLSVQISEIVTGLQRRTLDTAPAHAHDAPLQASGKSLQAECTGIIVTGRTPASTPYSGDEEEMRKKLTSTLLAGDSICIFDNITGFVKSSALAMVLTQLTYGDRLLGTNSQPALPTNMLVILTGNNIQLIKDMPSRAVISRIDPQCEQPQNRLFQISDLRDHVLKNRPQLVQAALTLLRGYYIHKDEEMPKLTASRYGRWDREIRAAIVWAGLADPFKSQSPANVSDPERGAAIAMLAAWRTNFGERELRLSEAIAATEPILDKPLDENQKELKAALLEVAADRDDPSRISLRRFSAWARENVDRVYDHRRLRKATGVTHGGSSAWQVLEIQDDTPFGYTTKETLNRLDGQQHDVMNDSPV